MVLLVGGTLLLTAERAGGHSEPPPPPPPPEAFLSIDNLVPLRWSWLHWWEANRERYLVPVVQGRPDQGDTNETLVPLREQAVAALTAALADPYAGTRAAAALALGRIGDPAATEALIRIAESDKDPGVVHHAITAIGLAGGAEAEAFLLRHPYATDFQKASGFVSLTLLEAWSPGTQDGLKKGMGGSALMANATGEALAMGPDGLDPSSLRNALGRVTNPWLAARMLEALGTRGDAKSDALLRRVAAGGRGAEQLAAWTWLKTVLTEKVRAERLINTGGSSDPARRSRGIDLWWQAQARLVAYAPDPIRPEGLTGLGPAVALGPEWAALGGFRAGLNPFTSAGCGPAR